MMNTINTSQLDDKVSAKNAFAKFETKENGVGNDKLNFAKIICEELTELLIKNSGKLGESFLIGLTGNTGTGKTMLLDIIKNELIKAKITIIDSRDYRYLIPQEQAKYLVADVIFIDDLFGEAKNLTEAQSDWDKGGYDLSYFAEFIYNIYNYNKVVIITSKFSLVEILSLIIAKDKLGRLTDRVEHLLSKVPQLELNRRTEAKTSSKSISHIMVKKMFAIM